MSFRERAFGDTVYDRLWDLWPGRASLVPIGVNVEPVPLMVVGARTREPALDVWIETSPRRFGIKLARLRLAGPAWFEVEIDGRTLRYCRWGGTRRRQLVAPPMLDTLLALAEPEFFLRRPRGSRQHWRAEALLSGVMDDHWWRCGDESCGSLAAGPGSLHYAGVGRRHRRRQGWVAVVLVAPSERELLRPCEALLEQLPPVCESVASDWNRSFEGAALLPELAFRKFGRAALGELVPASQWEAVPAAVAVAQRGDIRWLRRLGDAIRLPGSLAAPERRRSDARVARALDALPRSHVALGVITLATLPRSTR